MTKDTNEYTEVKELAEALKDEGFHKILTKDYTRPHETSDQVESASLHIYWNPEHYILAKIEDYYVDPLESRYRENVISNATMYYNIKPRDMHGFVNNHIASGWIKEDVWVGSQSMEDRFRATLKGLKESGEFVKWVERPFLWLNHYMEQGNSEEVREQIISELPEEVREVVNINADN